MKKEITAIRKRNRRVEIDKAWELSKTRKTIIALLTYFLVVIFLFLINAPKPWLNALIPTLGFILSTLTLQILKKVWISKIYSNKL